MGERDGWKGWKEGRDIRKRGRKEGRNLLQVLPHVVEPHQSRFLKEGRSKEAMKQRRKGGWMEEGKEVKEGVGRKKVKEENERRKERTEVKEEK